MNIPEKFYMAGRHPVAYNVGDLKALLAELPDDLPVEDGWGLAPELVVYNHGSFNTHLQLREQDGE